MWLVYVIYTHVDNRLIVEIETDWTSVIEKYGIFVHILYPYLTRVNGVMWLDGKADSDAHGWIYAYFRWMDNFTQFFHQMYKSKLIS